MGTHTVEFLSKYIPIFKISRYSDDCLVLDSKKKCLLVTSLYGVNAEYPENLPDDIVVLCDKKLNIALHCVINKERYSTRFYFKLEPCKQYTCHCMSLHCEYDMMKHISDVGLEPECDLNVICDAKQYAYLKANNHGTFFNLLFQPCRKAKDWTCEELITLSNNTAVICDCMLSTKILPDCRRRYVYANEGVVHSIDIQKEDMTLRTDGMLAINTLRVPAKLRGLSVPNTHIDNFIVPDDISVINITTFSLSSIFGDCVPSNSIIINSDLVLFTIGNYACHTSISEPTIVVHTKKLQVLESLINTDIRKIYVTSNTLTFGNVKIISESAIEYTSIL